MSKLFKKQINNIPLTDAHGGNGKRQLILSKDDPISANLQGMTKGFLPKGAIFDWHKHEGLDEFFIVLMGNGIIQFEDGTKMEYNENDLIYIPSNKSHRIENTGSEENVFFFVRITP